MDAAAVVELEALGSIEVTQAKIHVTGRRRRRQGAGALLCENVSGVEGDLLVPCRPCEDGLSWGVDVLQAGSAGNVENVGALPCGGGVGLAGLQL